MQDDYNEDLDVFESRAFAEAVSPITCMGKPTVRARCPCCGPDQGVRSGLKRRYRDGGRKPRYKDHR